MTRIGRAARRILTRSSGRIGKPDWPSNVTNTSSCASMIGRTCTCEPPGITIGRFVSVCGAIGVSSIASTDGMHDRSTGGEIVGGGPVGLATIKPSARIVITGRSSTTTPISMIRDSAPLVMTMSLRTT